MKIGICGAGGKMGKAVLDVMLSRGHVLGAAFEIESSPLIGLNLCSKESQKDLNVKINPINKDDLAEVDGIIDFSGPDATLNLIGHLKGNPRPLVIGTTGFSDEARRKIEESSGKMPVVLSPNMSLGVNLLFKLVEIASRTLGDDFDIEIFEAHHRFKKDAPSGTAKKLLEIVKSSAASLHEAPDVYDRTGRKEMRNDNEIGMMVMRGGDIVGDHTVHFVGMGERIELTHRASSREILAKGAVLAMEFLKDKGPGLYNMFDVLGI